MMLKMIIMIKMYLKASLSPKDCGRSYGSLCRIHHKTASDPVGGDNRHCPKLYDIYTRNKKQCTTGK